MAALATPAQVIAALEGTQPSPVIDRAFASGRVLFCNELSRQRVYCPPLRHQGHAQVGATTRRPEGFPEAKGVLTAVRSTTLSLPTQSLP